MNIQSIQADESTAGEVGGLTEIARRVGDLSVAIAGVLGDVEDLSGEVNTQSEALATMTRRTEEISVSGQSVTNAANTALDRADDAKSSAIEAAARIRAMVSEVAVLIADVSRIAEEFNRLDSAIAEVGKFSQEIGQISRKTSLLSLNAAIEASRAGEHGRGFMVVAREVKDLSGLTSEATLKIVETLGNVSQMIQAVRAETDVTLNRASGVQSKVDQVGIALDDLPEALSGVSSAQREIRDEAGSIEGALNGLQAESGSVHDAVSRSASCLKTATATMLNIVDTSEALTGMTARMGVETVDSPFIEAVTRAAVQVSEAFQSGVQLGHLSIEDLFDCDYVPVQGTNPQQVMTRFVAFTDRVLPSIQEPLLGLSDKVVFCAAVDRNGFLPTHNRKFSQTQRVGQEEWNAAHSRNRRIFADRVGLAAGKSRRPFLLQAYRRDMGRGQKVLMKDVSAPIYVQGRHWGGLRLAYSV